MGRPHFLHLAKEINILDHCTWYLTYLYGLYNYRDGSRTLHSICVPCLPVLAPSCSLEPPASTLY